MAWPTAIPRWPRGWPCSPGWPPPRTCRCGRRSRPSSWGWPGAAAGCTSAWAWAGPCCCCGWSPPSRWSRRPWPAAASAALTRAPDPGGRCAVTRPARPRRPSRFPDRGPAEQFAHPRDDLLAVELDGGHELIVGQAGQAVLQVEPGGAQRAHVRGDLAGHGLRRADVQRPVRAGFAVERRLGRDGKAALLGDQRDDLPPGGPELRLSLLVGGRDVAGRVHQHGPRWLAELLQRPPEQLRVGGEPGRRAADDGQRQREPEPGGADHRLRVAAHADPRRERPRLQVRYDVLAQQRRAGLALPGHRPALEQFGEQRGLLVEEILVVGQVVAEQRERLDARPAPEGDLGPAAGDRVRGGVALEHPDRVVRAQHGDGGAEPDLLGPDRDRGRY